MHLGGIEMELVKKVLMSIREEEHYRLGLTIMIVATIFLLLMIPLFKENDLELAIEDQVEASLASESQIQSVEDESIKEPVQIYVDIKGAVKNPGVYSLLEGDRLFDVIEMAGGLLPQAASQAVNQAQRLTDQMMIYIYTQSELDEMNQHYLGDYQEESALGITSPMDEEDTSGNNQIKVNINTAQVNELESLPGIGPKKAEAIIQYRTEQGSFQVKEDLMNISGIGEKTFQQLEGYITVN